MHFNIIILDHLFLVDHVFVVELLATCFPMLLKYTQVNNNMMIKSKLTLSIRLNFLVK